MAINIKDMQNTEGCYKIDSYAFERRAAKFGDSLGNSSYVLHFLKNTFWKNSFTIEFDFRTFYPDGMIFLSRVSISKYIFYVGTILLVFIDIGSMSLTLRSQVCDQNVYRVF